MSDNKADRIASTFNRLSKDHRAGLVTFITAGDPNLQTSLEILHRLPSAGADIIEIGMPFSDPMADGPAIQAASLRSLANGGSLRATLEMVRAFRKKNKTTPLILMGYFNPIYQYGTTQFVNDAASAGVDGLIMVDLPPEEDDELCDPARTAGLHWIRLVTPTTNKDRLSDVLANSSGFVYYVSIAGITGTQSAGAASIEKAVHQIKTKSDLPVAVGFGIKTREQVKEIGNIAEGVVVGSVIVNEIEQNLDANGQPKAGLVESVISLVRSLATDSI
ncbi:MAG: tryptophan synthase subunit alpha [Proteobacteria bacterium]|jgi:tryptophan synthase alpha chain|nr:tryptophan synthase subunit alpha [Pseudomonadota bacterium]MBT4108339.1 tryptophan synthase subunit alpha [Pseudomonadota bacterium]MBT4357326.1 tryptophan synthase subunit alpha [Pseudomonadota bacterium]MBT4986361.1 tryptophan synthase subunit alpha [Pseudomonadota bacterium]MBT5190354.1 tryptophan synthase subunit alpha [Pseudomonadota bacterium]